jgi:hypothetical protein
MPGGHHFVGYWTLRVKATAAAVKSQMGEFLKGYPAKMTAYDGPAAGYSRDGDSRGLARVRGDTI